MILNSSDSSAIDRIYMISIMFLNVEIRLPDVCKAVLAVNCGNLKHSGQKVLFTLEQTRGADFWLQWHWIWNIFDT